MLKLIIILVALGVVLLLVISYRRRVRSLPEISDDVFIKKFIDIYGDGSKESVLQERDNLSRQLGIPCNKLDPSYTFDELSEYLDTLGSYGLSIGDLESTVSELFERRGVKKPYKSPSTIGELIHEIIKVKTSGPSDSE